MSPFPDYNRPDATFFDAVADFGLLAGAVGCVVFVLMYGIFLNWRKTAAGRAIFYFMVAVVGAIGLVVLSRLTGGDYVFRDVLRLVVYSGVCITAWRLVFTLIRAWADGERSLNLPARERRKRCRAKTTDRSQKETP